MWFDEECSKFVHQRKQAKLQWLQEPNQTNADNLNKVRHETGRFSRNTMREHLKVVINELRTNSMNRNA
jgi:hypothetical protein